MFKVGEYLVYRKDVCKVKEIKETDNGLFYQLVPVDDETLKIEVPVENKDNCLRKVISKTELDNLLKEMQTIETIDCNERMLEIEYKQLLSTGNKEDIIKVLKTAYLRIQDRIKNKKKIIEKDTNYLEKAEKLLFNEFMVVLNLTYEETKNYIIGMFKEVLS